MKRRLGLKLFLFARIAFRFSMLKQFFALLPHLKNDSASFGLLLAITYEN